MSLDAEFPAVEAGREGERRDNRSHAGATFQVATPEPFCFNRPEEWEKWVRRFERFRVASGLSSRDGEIQVNTLIYAMGDQADDIFRSFTLSEEERKSYSVVKEKFDRHFIQRRNVIFERARFNRRKQEEGESAETFITALFSLAEHCGYGNLHDEMIRDRIVVGIRNSALSERLQLDARLTLDGAISQVRQAEAVKQQQPLLRGKSDTPVGAVQRTRGGYRGGRRSPTTPANPNRTQDKCPRCGRWPSHDRAQCPAKDQICNKCHKRGHFRVVCRSTAKVRGVQASPEEPGNAFLGAVSDSDMGCGVDSSGNSSDSPHRHWSGGDCDHRADLEKHRATTVGSI